MSLFLRMMVKRKNIAYNGVKMLPWKSSRPHSLDLICLLLLAVIALLKQYSGT